jgi:Predicted membrane protein (DUF2306)
MKSFMTGTPINVAGIEIPSDSPVFLAALGVHVLFGLSCVVAGGVAMSSRKRPGRHPRFGTIYYYCLSVVFASATVLSAMRWTEDYHLFILGTLSFATASLGRMALRRRWRTQIRLHISCMGVSYILLLTAFYVDNGKNLPLWNKLPQLAFWVLPAAAGIPFIVRALWRHPLVRNFSTADASTGGTAS